MSFYSVKDERDSLSSIFSFSGLKTFGGADLSAIYWGRKISNHFLEVLTSQEPLIMEMRMLQGLLQLTVSSITRYGKITLHSSYYYQDLGAKIKRVRIGRDEGFLNSDVLEQLISGTFPINIWPLYEAIGFLGRNLRFRDCMDLLSGRNVEAVVIDTMGIEGRKKSILASYHGRYHTIGMADLRAVATDMCPIYSGDYRATDSEAIGKEED